MTEFIFLSIVMATVIYLARPFWQRQPAVAGRDSDCLTDLQAQQDNLLGAIKEIEFDFRTGKISEEDFSQINREYRQQAMQVMQRIDALGNNGQRQRQLEAELQRMRSQRKELNKRFCSECGTPIDANYRFCAGCGKSLRQ